MHLKEGHITKIEEVSEGSKFMSSVSQPAPSLGNPNAGNVSISVDNSKPNITVDREPNMTYIVSERAVDTTNLGRGTSSELKDRAVSEINIAGPEL